MGIEGAKSVEQHLTLAGSALSLRTYVARFDKRTRWDLNPCYPVKADSLGIDSSKGHDFSG
jgi:hypothetical protein